METALTKKVFTILNPVEIDAAVETIRLELAKMPWVSRPLHIAQRFYKFQDGKAFYFPETYIPECNQKNQNYLPLTPNSAEKGLFFFMVGSGKPVDGYKTYPVGIIFSCNMELIDAKKLKNYLFTQELIKNALKVLENLDSKVDFKFEVIGETRDLRDTFREFVLNEIEQYNRAPLQCFRIDLNVTIEIEC